MTDAGTQLVLFDQQNGRVLIDPAEEGHLDAALTAYLESAGTRDTLLHLRMMGYSALSVDRSLP